MQVIFAPGTLNTSSTSKLSSSSSPMDDTMNAVAPTKPRRKVQKQVYEKVRSSGTKHVPASKQDIFRPRTAAYNSSGPKLPKENVLNDILKGLYSACKSTPFDNTIAGDDDIREPHMKSSVSTSKPLKQRQKTQRTVHLIDRSSYGVEESKDSDDDSYSEYDAAILRDLEEHSMVAPFDYPYSDSPLYADPAGDGTPVDSNVDFNCNGQSGEPWRPLSVIFAPGQFAWGAGNAAQTTDAAAVPQPAQNDEEADKTAETRADLTSARTAFMEELRESPVSAAMTVATFETQSTASLQSTSFDLEEHNGLGPTEDADADDNSATFHIAGAEVVQFHKFDLDKVLADDRNDNSTCIIQIDACQSFFEGDDDGIECTIDDHMGFMAELKQADTETTGEHSSQYVFETPIRTCKSFSAMDASNMSTSTSSTASPIEQLSIFRKNTLPVGYAFNPIKASNPIKCDGLDGPISSMPSLVDFTLNFDYETDSTMDTEVDNQNSNEAANEDDSEILGGRPFPQLVRMKPEHSLFDEAGDELDISNGIRLSHPIASH